MSAVPITEADLEAVERLLAASLARCGALQLQQRHADAARAAGGCLNLMRTIRETAPVHGVLADLILQPFEGAFAPFVPA